MRVKNRKMLKKILSITLLITFAFQQVSYATPTYQNLATSAEIHGPRQRAVMDVATATQQLTGAIKGVRQSIRGEANQTTAIEALIDLRRRITTPEMVRQTLLGLKADPGLVEAWILTATDNLLMAAPGGPGEIRNVRLVEGPDALDAGMNKRLMCRILTVLNDHWLMREGVIKDLPGELATKEWDEKSRFHFGRDKETGETVYVNDRYVYGLDAPGFHSAAVNLTRIIDDRISEGTLIVNALSRYERETMTDWERLVKRHGIREATERPASSPLVVLPDLPRGFAQAAREMHDTEFHVFVDLLQSETSRVMRDVMNPKTPSDEELPVRREVKKLLAAPKEEPVRRRGMPPVRKKVTFARRDREGLVRRYKYEEGAEELPVIEEGSSVFGVLSTDLIDEMKAEAGLFEGYKEAYLGKNPGARSLGVSATNPYLLVQHLLDGTPIKEEHFSSDKGVAKEKYEKLITIITDYKLQTGEIGMDILEDEEEQARIALEVQRRLNKTFAVEEDCSILPLNFLMLFGRPQPTRHHKYGGSKVRGIVEYVCPLRHTLNALRRLDTDRLPGAQHVLRASLLGHDLGKIQASYSSYMTSAHEARSGQMIDGALNDMGASEYSDANERALIKFLAASHSAFGIIYRIGSDQPPDMWEVTRELQIPDELAGVVSPQTVYLLHKRIYEADTSSIRNIAWTFLEGQAKEQPESATPVQRSDAMHKWTRRIRQTFEEAIAHRYQEAYSQDERFRSYFREMGIETHTAFNDFLSRFCSLPSFPRLFIRRQGEEFNIDDAAQAAAGIIPAMRGTPNADLIECIEQYFVFNDVGLGAAPGSTATAVAKGPDQTEASQRPREGAAAFLKGAVPTEATQQRNLIGDITMEGGEVVISYSQGQRSGKTVDAFASEIVPQSESLQQLLADGATIRIRRGLRSAAQTTPKGNVVHIPEFLANQLINGKAPMALLDKVVLRNELVHRIINQHLPRSKTLEEDFAIEVLATIDELKGALQLTGDERDGIIEWIDNLNLDEKDRTNIDEFFKLVDEIGAASAANTIKGLTLITFHIAKTYPAFKEFAEPGRLGELPFMVTKVLQGISEQAAFPDEVQEKVASVVQANPRLEDRKAFVARKSIEATKRVCSRLAGPFILEDIRNSRGELVSPGFLTIIDLHLERQGLEKPAGQEHFLTPDEGRNALRGMRNDPNFSTEFIERKIEDFPVYDEGQARIFRRTAWRNTIYDKLIRDKKVNLTNREIEYLFNNLSENGIGRYLLMFIRGQEKRSRTLAAAARKRKGLDAEKEAAAAQEAAGKYKRLWERCSKMAATLGLEGEAKAAWKDVRTTKIDARTGLELGNPDKNPFGDLAGIDFDEFHREVEGRTRSKANIWSVSGVRQIFDPTFEDLPLPQGFPWRLGIGTEPTRAAKVQACTQARLFAEMIQAWDKEGSDRFEERIPLSAMKGKTDSEKRKKLKGVKKDFSDLLAITQKGKHKTGPKKITVFTETRSTGPALADADVRALLAAGIEVEYGGVASVTQAAVYAKENEDIDGVIYISASHNDEGYNGIKLFLGDGRVMPEAVAYPYIAVLKENELVDPANTRRVAREVSAVPLSDVKEVYANVDKVKVRAIKTEEEYRDRVITGIPGKDASAKRAIEDRIKAIKKNNLKLKLAVIIDPNGGSREDREYFERLGFKVYELNPRPRYDMNHELCPSAGAVLKTKDDLERIRKQAQREGYALAGSIHYDTDADRRCLQPADGMGGFHLRDDMAHICFAIDVIGYVLTEKAENPDKVVGVVCNGPTSILLEELAERFGFVLLRTQTGEANVVDGMDRLEDMTFGQAQRMSKKAERGQEGSKEVFVPKSLEGKFGQNTPIKVVVAGEGSNGSDFTKALLVRDPLHTIRSMVKFMDPLEGPSLVRAYFDALGVEIDEAELATWWDSEEEMATLMYRLIDALPASFATDFFTIGGPGMMVNPPSILGKVKDNFDVVFDEQYGSEACENLASIISDAGIPDVSAGDISYDFINYEDEAKVGRGARKGTAPIGRKIGDGGYKVKFYVTTKDGKKHALGWIWFRDSLTEAGLTRSGASFVLPKALAALVPGLSKSVQEKLVHEAYDSLKQTLGDAVKSAVAETTKQVLAATPQTLDSSPLRDYADELREEQDGKTELVRIQEDANGYIDELMVALEREMQSGDLCEAGALEKARFANNMNRLSDAQYNGFLVAQKRIAEQRNQAQIIQLASRYIDESARLAAKKKGDVEHKTGTPKDVNKAVASAKTVRFLSGRRQVKVDPSEKTYADGRRQEAEYIDAARTTLKNMFIGYEASGERRQDTIAQFGAEFLKAVEAFINEDINLVGVTPRDGSPFIYFGDENNHQSLHVGTKREVIYIGQGLYDQIKSKEGSLLAAAVAHDLGRFAGLSDEKVEEAERHIVGRSQRGDKGSKLDDKIDEIAERHAMSQLKPDEIFTSIAKWVTAEDALAQARERVGSSKRVMISYPLDQPPPQAETGPPGRNQAYETAVLVDLDNAEPLHNLANGARWTLLESQEGNTVTLVAESLRTPDPSTNHYSTPHVLHDFIANNGYRHATQDGLSFTIEGNANRTYVSESRQFLKRFLAEVKTQGKPVLLRIPVEALIGLTKEERLSWLLTLNEAENVFVEIYTMQQERAVTDITYRGLGLEALHEKNQKLESLGFTSNRENTVTLLVTTKDTESAKFKGIIEASEALQNSVIVPIARSQRDEDEGKGDAAGLIRGSLFGFRLIDIARDSENTALIDEARESYQNLMALQGATNLRIGRQDIRNLLSADSERRASALRKIAGSLPEETAVSMEERLEIFRQAEIMARSA